MTVMTSPLNPIDEALHHLLVAAARAEVDGDRDPVTPELFSPWGFLAAQVRLVAESVAPTNPWLTPTPADDSELPTVLDSLTATVATLDAATGDPQALELLWHVRELTAATHQVQALVDLEQAAADASSRTTPPAGGGRR